MNIMKERKFDWNATSSSVLEGIDLKGENAIITGSTGGMGFDIAQRLSEHGANVTVLGRTEEKARVAVEKLRELTGNNFEYGVMELDKFDTVKAFAKQWKESHERLDILINNAGIMGVPFTLTEDGFELQFATNHIGHFLLTNLLVEHLEKGTSSRVISVSSNGHWVCPIEFDDIHYKNREYSEIHAYGQSKIANVWFANEFDRRFKDKGIRAFSAHPGGVGTKLGRYLTEDSMKNVMAQVRKLESDEPGKTIPQGAATAVWGATAPELEGMGGLYLINSHISTEGTDVDECHAPYAYDESSEKKLWEMSNKMLGTDF